MFTVCCFFFFFFFFFFFVCFFFFFFQAEDGIRDLYVTGVQTCALPISVVLLSSSLVVTTRVPSGENAQSLDTTLARVPSGENATASMKPEWRSEERRVGKECRSRWWPYQ